MWIKELVRKYKGTHLSQSSPAGPNKACKVNLIGKLSIAIFNIQNELKKKL